MEFITGLITNQVLISAAAGWFVAQVSKVIIDMIQNGFSVERLTGSGGMPSSHSATVTALAVSAGIVYGGGSFEFVMALFFAIIVIYDAQGVRMETGKEAKVLNRMRQRDIDAGMEPVYEKPLQEKMGHTMPEIIVGIIIGVAAAIIVCNIM